MTKNSLRLNKYFFGRPKKGRNSLDNWSTKKLTKTTFVAKNLAKVDYSSCSPTYLDYKRQVTKLHEFERNKFLGRININLSIARKN